MPFLSTHGTGAARRDDHDDDDEAGREYDALRGRGADNESHATQLAAVGRDLEQVVHPQKGASVGKNKVYTYTVFAQGGAGSVSGRASHGRRARF